MSMIAFLFHQFEIISIFNHRMYAIPADNTQEDRKRILWSYIENLKPPSRTESTRH